jgi:hypothetical protein
VPTITPAIIVIATKTVPVETATAVLPTETRVEAETAVLPTETETEVLVPTAEATAAMMGTAIPMPIVDGEVFGPGQKVSGTLAGGGEQTYPIDGVKFTPRFVFVETPNEIDLLLSVENTEANFSGPGGPEVLVFTAAENGRYDLILRNQSQTEGAYTLYLYDAAKPVPGAVHQPNVALAAGASAQFQVESRGGRPVLLFVDPVDQSDVSVTVTTAEGQTVADANYSGSGSAEASFVLPLQTTRYTVTVKEVNNAPAQINVLLVPLE